MSKTLQQALRFNANITIQIDDASQLSDFLKAIVLEALPKPVSEPVSESEILLRSREAAKLLDISERALWGFAKSGRIMKPICIGKSVRWNARELRRWAAGGPSNEEWMELKEKWMAEWPRNKNASGWGRSPEAKECGVASTRSCKRFAGYS